MWSRLLPSGVLVEWGDPAEGARDLLAQEAHLVRGAVEKRRLEFAKGRECARAGLARLGIHDFPLLIGPSREPLWPAHVVGSITHTQGHCAAAVASSRAYIGIGIDAEPASCLSEELTPRICVPAELERLPASTHLARELAVRMLFSAKEAVYKCQFPSTRAFLDFKDVAIALLDDGSFEARFPGGRVPWLVSQRIEGRWLQTSGLLLSAAWISAP